MIPVKLSEDKYEEMTVEVDLAIIKGSPLEQDSTLSAATDDDDSRHGLVIAGTHDEAAIAEKSEEIIATESMCADERKPKQKVSKTTFPCEVCCKVFLKRSRLSSHMIVHTEEKEFICSICNKGFKNKPQLQRHSNTHSAAPNFCCNICGRGFKHNDVAKHIKRFHSGPRKTRRGGVANPKAPSSSPFGAQPTLQHDPCEAVPQSVYHQNQSSLHLPAPQSVIIPNQSSNKMIQLQPDHETLLNHKNDNTNQDFVLNSEHTITQNQSFGLGIPEMIPVEGSDNGRTHIFMSSQSLHGCSDCPESFTNQSALANHVLSHTHSVEDQKRSSSKAGKNRHQCPMCLKTFTRATGLAGHLHLHNRSERRRQPNPNFCCPMCGKTFIRRTGLNGHILQHSGVLRFWCDEPDCGKGFVHSYQLTRHKRLHSGILPYSCQVCGRSFRHNDLTKHMRTHTGAKPYNCCHCGKAFAFTSSLRTHERMHLALKEHICEICNIGFTTSAGLQRHIKCHEDDSQILCPSCGKLFLSKLHFGMHLQESLLCAGHQQQKVQQPSQDLTEQLLCQVHAEQNQNLQVLPTTHLQHHELSEIPANAMAEIRSTDSLSIHVNSHHQLPQQGDTPLLAALAPSEVEPVISEHIPQLASKNSGTVPVLVPFSMSVPVSVPFGLSLNSNHSEQLQMNHFLTWGEQKYCVDQ